MLFRSDDVFPYILNNYKMAVKKFHLMSSALTLMGDSAGGGLCLSLLQLLENEKIDKPIFLHTGDKPVLILGRN